MAIQAVAEGLEVYLLIFSRIGGMILFNPLLSRKSIPAQFKLALILGITILLVPVVGDTMPGELTGLMLVLATMKELLVGVACGFIFQIFYFLLFTTGDVVDMGFGLSMAKAFDPGANVQMSVSGNIFQLMFILYFFLTDSHLVMIRLMASSYDLVGLGAVTFGADIGKFVTGLFVTAFSLAMRLAMPFIASSFILEFSMGILMKLIPQINVFTIHFQLKIIFGFLLLFMFAGPTAEFVQRYIDTMLMGMQNVFGAV